MYFYCLKLFFFFYRELFSLWETESQPTGAGGNFSALVLKKKKERKKQIANGVLDWRGACNWHKDAVGPTILFQVKRIPRQLVFCCRCFFNSRRYLCSTRHRHFSSRLKDYTLSLPPYGKEEGYEGYCQAWPQFFVTSKRLDTKLVTPSLRRWGE